MIKVWQISKTLAHHHGRRLPLAFIDAPPCPTRIASVCHHCCVQVELMKPEHKIDVANRQLPASGSFSQGQQRLLLMAGFVLMHESVCSTAFGEGRGKRSKCNTKHMAGSTSTYVGMRCAVAQNSGEDIHQDSALLSLRYSSHRCNCQQRK